MSNIGNGFRQCQIYNKNIELDLANCFKRNYTKYIFIKKKQKKSTYSLEISFSNNHINMQK